MKEPEEIIESLDRIDDKTLLGSDDETLVQSAYSALGGRSFDGLALRAPRVVDPAATARLPVIAVVSYSTERNRTVPLADNAVVVCTRLDRRGHWLTPLFAPPAHKIPLPVDEPPPPPDDPRAQASHTTGVRVLDIKPVGGIAWEPGRYALRIISWDWLSNTEIVTLTGSRPEEKEDAAPLRPEMSSFRRSSRSPEVHGIGIAVALASDAVRHGDQVEVYGTVSLPREPAWTHPASQETTPLAVLPGLLLLKRKDILNPLVIEVMIPILPQDVPAGEPLKGYFQYELSALRGQPLPAGRYQMYLLVGEYVDGPHPLGVEG